MAKLWGWFTNNPIAQIITAAVLALIGWEVVKRNIQETGRIKERERIAAAQAEEQRRMNEARAQQSQENQDNANRADETAASVPWVRHRDELWERSPGDARILLDPTERGGS
jgi:hypothetical protein